MMNTIKARIYGDSLMKGTVMDSAYRYHAMVEELLNGFKTKFGIETENRARFGITVEKGLSMLKKDIEKGLDCEYALVEFGGNDCNFKWNEISVYPDEKHLPLTDPEVFMNTYIDMVTELQARGVKPVLMTLPPIDAERYLEFLGRNGNDPKRILKWLGDVQMIYRFHESYSNMIRKIAQRTKSYLVDVREYFLDKHNYRDLMSIDGLHPTEEGYRLVIKAFEDFAASISTNPVIA
ncbi:MAG: SGNH/GDSL hydrolase family protein [Clostridia bacterium]